MGLRGKQKLSDRWERHPYVVTAQPNPDIPVYEVQHENTRARKTEVLHRNLLLPFSCLPPCNVERRKSSVANVADSRTEAIAPTTVLDDLSVRQSDIGYDASMSSSSETDETEVPEIPRYIIPARRKPGDQGLSPRSTGSTSSESLSSNPSQLRRRPKRTQKKPTWMNSD